MGTSCPIAHCPRSCLTPEPQLSSSANREAFHSVRTLTHAGLALAQRLGVVLWASGPGLSVLSLLPLNSWGDLRPWEPGFEEQRVQPRDSVGTARREGNKYEKT